MSGLIPRSALAWLASAYLLLLLMLGGGGSPAPLSELACQLLAALTLVAWVWLGGPSKLQGQRVIWWVTVPIIAIPAIQLIPLPPAAWQALPGRDLLKEALALVGSANRWHPVSIAPQRTLEALLSLLPPLMAMILAASLSLPERRDLLKVIAGFALASIAVGAAQLASGGSGPLFFYNGPSPGVLYGFQANRNAQVDVLLIGLLAAVAAWHAPARTSRGAAGMLGAAVLLILLGAALTGSRAGIALVPLVIGCCLLLQPWRLPATSPVRRPGVLLLSGLALGGMVLAVWQSRNFTQVIDRFDFAGEYRPDIWRDTLFAIGQHWPVGSGMGTFTRIIGPAERLEAIGPTLPNRAHNDYLELLLEAGAAGAFIWLAIIVVVLAAAWRALKDGSVVAKPQAVFATGTLAIVILHSLVDYPLRSMALAGLVGVAAAFVLAPPKVGDAPS